MVNPNNPESLENDLSLAFCIDSESGGLGGEVCVLSISLWEIQKQSCVWKFLVRLFAGGALERAVHK